MEARKNANPGCVLLLVVIGAFVALGVTGTFNVLSVFGLAPKPEIVELRKEAKADIDRFDSIISSIDSAARSGFVMSASKQSAMNSLDNLTNKYLAIMNDDKYSKSLQDGAMDMKTGFYFGYSSVDVLDSLVIDKATYAKFVESIDAAHKYIDYGYDHLN